MKFFHNTEYIFITFLLICLFSYSTVLSQINSRKKNIKINNFDRHKTINKDNLFSKRIRSVEGEGEDEDDLCQDIINDKDGFYPLKIFIDETNFDAELEGTKIIDYKDIIINSVKKVAKILEGFLTEYSSSQPKYSNDEINTAFLLKDWDHDIFGSILDVNFVGLNYTNGVWFKVLSNSEIHNSIASSKIVMNEGMCGRPQVGIIYLNEDINYSELDSNYLDIIMLQQLTHLLGFHQNIDYDVEEEVDFIGLIQKDSSNKYYVNSENVINYAKAYFNCDTIDKIPIIIDENDLPHWPSRLLLGDYMADYIYPEEQVISGFTIAFLKDLDYLEVKHSFTGGLMRYGKHQGCEFVNEKCITYDSNNHYTNKHENDFFYPNENTNFDGHEPSCSSGRLSKTYHKLYKYEAGQISAGYEYFPSNILYGGLKIIDFCPVSEYLTHSLSNPYEGRCSNTQSITDDERNKFGESRSVNSFCALNNFVHKGSSGYDSNIVRAGCYNMYCSSNSLTIQVGEDYLVCPREGGKITSDNYQGYILCPDYNLICTGISEANTYDLCNDIFSCISNKIKENEASMAYGYDIKTTQDSSIYKSAGVSEDDCSELAPTGGKCPQYCRQCKENKRCFQCKSSYGLQGENEEASNEEIKCTLTATLTNGEYYTKEVNSYIVHYPCKNKIENCVKCSDANTCTECSEKYMLDSNHRCKEIVENCDEYITVSENEKECKKCKDNFGLIKGEETSCMKMSDLNPLVSQNYYYKVSDDPDYYVKCSEKIDKCDKCLGESNCIQCFNNNNDIKYGIIEDDHTQCKDLSQNDYYYDSTNQKYFPCSHKLSNCKKCSQNGNLVDCTECESNSYALVHGDFDECTLKTTMQSDESNNYFSDEQGNNYYSCSNSLYHSVENCLTCNNKDTCLTCKSGYQLLNSNDLCISNSDLKRNKYILINNIYKACSEVIKGCEKCSDEETCQECNIAYDLDIYNKCIPSALSLTKYYQDPTSGKYKKCEEAINHCEECSSATVCTECKNGYELDGTSSCKEIEKESGGNENESADNNTNKDSSNDNNKNDKDYDKIKALSIGAIILGSIGTIASIVAIVLMFVKKIFIKSTSYNAIDATNSANINNNNNNEENNEVVYQSSRRSIHNEQKNINDNNE